MSEVEGVRVAKQGADGTARVATLDALIATAVNPATNGAGG